MLEFHLYGTDRTKAHAASVFTGGERLSSERRPPFNAMDSKTNPWDGGGHSLDMGR